MRCYKVHAKDMGITYDQALDEAAVQTAANANMAAGVSNTINSSDIQIGIWDQATKTMTHTANQPKSVRVM